MSQEIGSHRWKNRILLVLTEDTNNTTFKNQILELKANQKGLGDRKLIVYQIMKDTFTTSFEDVAWQKTPESFLKLKEKNNPFEIILIGLDGGIKLKQNTFLTCEKLFNVIDVMPMRKNELLEKIRNKTQNYP